LKLELDLSLKTLENLQKKFARSQSLFKQNIINTEDFEQIKFEYQRQQISVDLARLNLEHTQIKAPIAGVITDRMIKEGNMLTVHQPTFKITDLKTLYLKLHVPETQMHKMRKGHKASLSIDAFPEKEFTGKIIRINPVIDSGSGTFKVTINVKNPMSILKPGMFTRVNIVYDRHENTLIIPKDAIITDGESHSVFIVKEGTAQKKEVILGYEGPDGIEASGVDFEQSVVTAGIKSIKDGSKIKIINQ